VTRHIATFTSNSSAADFQELSEPEELATAAAMQVIFVAPSDTPVSEADFIQLIAHHLEHLGQLTVERMCLTQGKRQNSSIYGVYSVRSGRGFEGAATIRLIQG
jgi:hypothetical protein